MKKTAKKKIDEAIGITLIVIIGLFVGRYYLSDVEGYREIEERVSQKLNLPAIKEKIVETLDPGAKEREQKSKKEYEEKKIARKAKEARERRPTFDIPVPYKTNEMAIEYLCRGKVDARFDHPRFENHDKFVLIDDKILILGNHNWSKQSLTINKEASVMIKAFPGNPEYAKHFCGIKLARPEETKKGRTMLIKELQRRLLKRTEGKG